MKNYRIRVDGDNGNYPVHLYATHTQKTSSGGTIFFIGNEITAIAIHGRVECVDDEERTRALRNVSMADFFPEETSR